MVELKEFINEELYSSVNESFTKVSTEIIKKFEDDTKSINNDRRRIIDVVKEVVEFFDNRNFSVIYEGDVYDTPVKCQIVDLYKSEDGAWFMEMEATAETVKGSKGTNSADKVTGDFICAQMEELPIIKKYCEYVTYKVQRYQDVKRMKLRMKKV